VPPSNLTIDQFFKVRIQRLIRSGNWSGQLQNGLPWSILHSPFRIRVADKEWPLTTDTRHLGGLTFYVVGADGKRYQQILMSPDTTVIGTRGEIQSQLGILYQSQRERTKRRRIRQRAELFKRLRIHANPRLTNVEFNPPNKPYHQSGSVYYHNLCQQNAIIVKQPKWMRGRTWMKLLNRLRKYNGFPPIPYIAPPPKVSAHKREIAAINRILGSHVIISSELPKVIDFRSFTNSNSF
jgi:hypothetical protein